MLMATGNFHSEIKYFEILPSPPSPILLSHLGIFQMGNLHINSIFIGCFQDQSIVAQQAEISSNECSNHWKKQQLK